MRRRPARLQIFDGVVDEVGEDLVDGEPVALDRGQRTDLDRRAAPSWAWWATASWIVFRTMLRSTGCGEKSRFGRRAKGRGWR